MKSLKGWFYRDSCPIIRCTKQGNQLITQVGEKITRTPLEEAYEYAPNEHIWKPGDDDVYSAPIFADNARKMGRAKDALAKMQGRGNDLAESNC